MPEPNSELTAELPLFELLELLLALVFVAPESLTVVAESAPAEFLAPWMTTESPGRSARFDTPWLLVILVAEESLTLTVFPDTSVR